jgi:hypothetical protein
MHEAPSEAARGRMAAPLRDPERTTMYGGRRSLRLPARRAPRAPAAIAGLGQRCPAGSGSTALA